MTDADRFLRDMGIERYDELGEQAPEAEFPVGKAGTRQDHNEIPPALAAKPGTTDSMLDDLGQLKREAAQLQSIFSVNNNPDASYAGQDSSGSITVEVDGKGQVIGAQIATSWRDSIGTHGLGPAVLEAISDGTNQVAAAWSTSFAEREEQDPGESAPSPEPEQNQASTGTSTIPGNQQNRNALQELLTLVEGVEDALDNFERHTSQQTNQHVVGHGPENSVKVTINGAKQAIDVEVARNFAGRAPGERLSRELLGAFNSAYERASSLNGDSSPGDGTLDKIRTLSNDPAMLLAYLGLTDEGKSQ